jgi:hypothetical protein
VLIAIGLFLSVSVPAAAQWVDPAQCEYETRIKLSFVTEPWHAARLLYWFDLTAEDLGLSPGCLRPWLPPEMDGLYLDICYYVAGDVQSHCVPAPVYLAHPSWA